MRYCMLCVLLAGMLLSSCEFSVKTGPAKEKEITARKIRNGISIKANGITVEQAFLVFEDGSLVPDDNKVQVNQQVKLRLISSGWNEKEGQVFLDASEKMETSEGDVMLDEKDMFRDYTAGIAAKDAEVISLSVVITGVSKLYDYFTVSFRVQDKTDPARFAEGEYKLYLV